MGNVCDHSKHNTNVSEANKWNNAVPQIKLYSLSIDLVTTPNIIEINPP